MPRLLEYHLCILRDVTAEEKLKVILGIIEILFGFEVYKSGTAQVAIFEIFFFPEKSISAEKPKRPSRFTNFPGQKFSSEENTL